MIVKTKEKKINLVPIKSIDHGDCFSFVTAPSYFMKCRNPYNAPSPDHSFVVDLKTGLISQDRDDSLVIPLKADCLLQEIE